MKEWWKRLKCKWFHKRDHECWDDTFTKEYPEGIPGKCIWLCNKCKRHWATVNPKVLQTDCADDRGVLPEKYYRQPGFELILKRCKRPKEERNE